MRSYLDRVDTQHKLRPLEPIKLELPAAGDPCPVPSCRGHYAPTGGGGHGLHRMRVGGAGVKFAKIMSFEQFAAQAGASRHAIGDVALQNPAGHIPRRTWAAILRSQSEKDAALIARRADLRAEFAALVASGDIIEPTSTQRLEVAAQGEGERAAAARRILAKKAARP